MVQYPNIEITIKTMVCRLNKAIYGIKQTPRIWYELHLTEKLLSFCFVSSKCDPSLFLLKEHRYYLYVVIYVNDIITIGSSSTFIQKMYIKNFDRKETIFPAKLRQMKQLD